MWRKEQKHQHVSLEKAEAVAANADGSLENPDETADNLRQNLVAHQKEIETILNSNRRIAARQFRVLLILTHDPELTDTEIAKRLKCKSANNRPGYACAKEKVLEDTRYYRILMLMSDMTQ